MQNISNKSNIIIKKPEVFLPKNGIDYNKWAVIACDQHTSPNSTYWEEVEKYVGDNPSTLKLIFPEYYLNDKDNIEERISLIHRKMEEYLKDGIVEKFIYGNNGKGNFIYTRRKLSNNKIRQGLTVLLDLEKYSYKKGDKSAIRPTEGIVEERLPIRIKIREGAPLEFPHILMLIDDPDKRIIEPLGDTLDKHHKLFDFDLMMGGGHIEGYAITSEKYENNIFSGLDRLSNSIEFSKRYGFDREEPAIVIAVGDGNHSLASAKSIWEKTKKNLMENNEAWENHPARYAMAEVVNIHDESLEFEPIHRVLFNIKDMDLFHKEIEEFYLNKGIGISIEQIEISEEEYKNHSLIDNKFEEKIQEQETQMYWIMHKDMSEEKILTYTVTLNPGIHSITVGSLQLFLDDYLSRNNDVEIDYIHGTEDLLNNLGVKSNVGFLLPGMNKSDLFKTVAKEGVTPRKTFSMGESDTKAYYIMGRKIS